MAQLLLSEFLELAGTHKRVGVFKKISEFHILPHIVYSGLKKEGAAVMLESGIKDKLFGRYSYIGYKPYASIEKQGDPTALEQFENYLNTFRCAEHNDLPVEVSGAVGFLTYDAVRLCEDIPDRHDNELQLPDLCFFFHEVVLVFDHFDHTLTICICQEVSDNPANSYHEAMQKIAEIEGQLPQNDTNTVTRHRSEVQMPVAESDLSDREFCELVEKAKHYIHIGDIFQVVISRRFQKQCQASPLSIYRKLLEINPSPFMFLLETAEFAIVGASPERLVKVKDGCVETNPIAGTRKRSHDPEEDLALEKSLLQDEKELAEHMMLVDLARNDIGRVSQPGSVAIKDFKSIHRFSHVMHIVTTVYGAIEPNKHALEAIKSVLPAGTLSGAPKIRAMQIIDELEQSRRGLYGGAICMIDRRGNLESCIAIRMAVIKDGMATVRTGAGIVYDSVPEKESDESRHKAQGILEAIHLAEEEIA